MAENATVQIPKDVLEPIIAAHMTKALAEAMGTRGDIITAAVQRVMTSKVDKEGKFSTSTYDTVPFSEWLVGRTFRELATTVFREAAQEYKDALRAEFAKQLGASKSKLAKRLAESMVNRFDSMTTDCHLRVEVTIEERNTGY